MDRTDEQELDVGGHSIHLDTQGRRLDQANNNNAEGLKTVNWYQQKLPEARSRQQITEQQQVGIPERKRKASTLNEEMEESRAHLDSSGKANWQLTQEIADARLANSDMKSINSRHLAVKRNLEGSNHTIQAEIDGMLPQEMATEEVEFSDLFQKNCTEILQKIFLYLDPRSLHSSRQVCQQWNTFVLSSVWGSRSGINSLKRRLHYNWLNKEPEVQVFSHNITDWFQPLDLRDNCLVVSVSGDRARVIDLVSQEIVGHLDHPSNVTQAVITETWIITNCRPSGSHLAAASTVIIWNRETLENVRVISGWHLEGATETADRVIYLSLTLLSHLFLFKMSPNKSQMEKILSVELTYNLLVKNDDTPSLVTVKRHQESHWRIRIDEVLKDEVATRTIEYDGPVIHPLLALSGPHLVLLDWGKMKVWNINTSTMLYSIDMDHRNRSMVIQNNLVKVECLGKIYVFDGTTIEDRKSVMESKREIIIRTSCGHGSTVRVLFDKSMFVEYSYSHSYGFQDLTIKNFWI